MNVLIRRDNYGPALLIAALLALYLPTYFDLATKVWTEDRNAHGPIIFLVIAWAIWRQRDLFSLDTTTSSLAAGGLAFSLGLLLYVVGRSQDILFFEVGSQIPMYGGLLLLTFGSDALRRLWFPLLFILFLIPLPGVFMDAITGPLKLLVSAIVDELLYRTGYPVARDGVVLSIGHYQVLIADACAGLNSMYSLTALGLVYIYVRKHVSWIQNMLLLLAILPIAFVANIGRVTALVLITYYFGDAAGQGFLHDFAGATEFLVALSALFLVDSLIVLALPDIES